MIVAGEIHRTAPELPLTGDEPPVTVPRVPAREAAEDELSRPMYHENDPSLFQRALDRFWDWVGDLFDAAARSTPGGGLGLLAIVLLIALLLAALRWRLGTPRRTPATSGSALFDDHPRSAAQHRAAAEAHATAHRWSQAVQARVRAVVRSLEERALLDPCPGRTADEAATEAGLTLPTHADQLRAAAQAFDAVTYGGRTADEQTYRRLTALDSDIERTRPVLTPAQGATE
ncbi:DUF4129 domain-containing protein [Streptomyces sp. O3]